MFRVLKIRIHFHWRLPRLAIKKRSNRRTGRTVKKGLKVAISASKKKLRDTELLVKGLSSNTIRGLEKIGKKYGFKSEVDKDFGFGKIDLVMNIRFHPVLSPITCGFIRLKEQEGGSRDLQDGQFSLRKIEEAMMVGMRSGMDRTYLVCDNEKIAKSITGQIEWLASFGSIIRFDAYSSAFFSKQEHEIKIKPSQVRHEQKIRQS